MERWTVRSRRGPDAFVCCATWGHDIRWVLDSRLGRKCLTQRRKFLTQAG